MLYVFGDCELDTCLYVLRHADQDATPSLKAFQLLAYLLEHRDRVVTRQELCEQVWPDLSISDTTLDSTVRLARQAVGDNGRAQRVVKTFHGYGYRFIAPVEVRSEMAADSGGQVEPAPPVSSTGPAAFVHKTMPISNAHPAAVVQYCTNCGIARPPAANFCFACGVPFSGQAPSSDAIQTTPTRIPIMAPGLPQADRRQLTVMFCDIVGSTRLSTQLELEDYRELIRTYQAVCAEVIRRFDGYIAQYLGDGILVYFGYPQAHEDDARRAVLAALGIVETLASVRERLRQEKGVFLAVRIGIHTGLVLVAEMGGCGHRERLAVGDVPNFTARIQSVAPSNAVVVSAATARLVQGYFICEELGTHTFEGVDMPLKLSRVLRASGAQGRLDAVGPGTLTPLVGRHAEIDLLLRRCASGAEGPGQVVILNGEAGIGKSRIVRVMRELIGEASYIWLECQCSPYHQHSALHPIIELCQRIFRWQPDDTAATKLQKLDTGLPQFALPLAETRALLASLLSLADADAYDVAFRLSPQEQRRKTLEALLTILSGLASQTPVLLVVEDLHWSDPSTLDFLTLLIDQVPITRLCLVCTARPSFEIPWGTRSFQTLLTLTPLPCHQVEQMVTHITGGKPLPVEVLQLVADKSDGVPLYVEEMTKAVLESEWLRETADHYELTAPLPTLAIPATLHDSLMARLDRLDTAKGLAQLGAALGRQFPYALLSAVAQQEAETLQRELGRLVASELMYQQGLLPQATYVFKHTLIQETAYQALARSTRQAYHKRIARVLAEQFPDTVTAQPELLAHHYTEASLVEEAIPWWQRAGQRAIERSANQEAISHLTKGLVLLETLPDTPARGGQELTLQLALGTALSVVKGYGAPEASVAYTRARTLCQQVGDNQSLFAALSGLRRYYNNMTQYKVSLELAEQHLQLAHRLASPAETLRAHHALGLIRFYLGEFASALHHFEQAITLYDPQSYRSHTFDPMMISLGYAGWVLWFMGYPDQALERINQALTLARQLSQAYTLASALNLAASLHEWRREIPSVQELSDAELDLGHRHGFVRWVGGALIRKGWALAEQGAVAEGIEQLQQGLRMWRDLTRLGGTHLFSLLAEAYRKAGRADDGLGVLDEAMDVLRAGEERFYEAELHRLRGELFLQTGKEGKEQTAEASFRQALRVARRQQAKSLELRAATSLSRVWQRQGKRLKAYQILSEVYHCFSEGFDTLDLQEAKALLDDLS